MPPHVTVVVIDSDDQSRKTIEAVLRQRSDAVKLLGTAFGLSDGLALIRKTSPMVAIIEVKDIEAGVRNIRDILSEFPHVSIFATASDKTSEAILKVMRAGATEYLLRPVAPADLEDALRKIGRLWISEPAGKAVEGNVLTLYNPMGGVGVTTIAVNLAASLVSDNIKVVLVDLNRYSGDISSFLDINPLYNLSTVTSNIAKLDASFISSILTKHSSGVLVLAEPKEVYEAISITPEEIRRVLAFLKTMFSYVIVDTGGHIDEHNLSAFEASDKIFFTFVPSLPSLKNTKRYLSTIDKIGFPVGKIKLIVNRHRPKDEISVEDIEKVLNHHVFMSIPNDYESVINSINKGMPLVKLSPHSQVSKGISKLAELVKRMCGPAEGHK